MLRLDFNLVLTMINLVVLYLILRKFLFRPLMNIMEQRRTMIADGLQHAEDTKKEAYALKSQYESAFGGAKEESTRIIGQAKKDAKAEYDRILDEADQAAGKLMKDARETIDLEKEKTLRDMQSEVAALAVSAAKKMVKQQYGADADQAAYDQFLKEAGDAHDDK